MTLKIIKEYQHSLNPLVRVLKDGLIEVKTARGNDIRRLRQSELKFHLTDFSETLLSEKLNYMFSHLEKRYQQA